MPRFIVECKDPTDIILGMKAIKYLIESGSKFTILGFTNDGDRLWYVKKTKTGYSARTT